VIAGRNPPPAIKAYSSRKKKRVGALFTPTLKRLQRVVKENRLGAHLNGSPAIAPEGYRPNRNVRSQSSCASVADSKSMRHTPATVCVHAISGINVERMAARGLANAAHPMAFHAPAAP